MSWGRAYIIGQPSSPAGLVQVNLGGSDINTQMAMNVFNSVISIGFSGGATSAALDAFGYPVHNFTGTIDCFFTSNVVSTNGPWVLSWPAGRSAFALQIQSPTFASSPVNCTVVNGSGSGVLQVTGDAVHAGSVTLNFNFGSPTSIGTMSFLGSYAGNWANNTSGVMSLVRQSDVASYNSGQYWTPEFVNLIKNLNPRSIRPMGWNLPRGSNVDSNESLWAYRNTTSQLSWFAMSFPPTAWSGGAGTAGTISVATGTLTAAAATDTTAGPADGEMIMGNVASTVNPVTIASAGSNAGNCQLNLSGTGFNATTDITVGQTVMVARDSSGGSPPRGFQTVHSIDSATQITLNTAAVASFTGSLGYQRLAVTGKWTKLILNNEGQPIGFGDPGFTAGVTTFVYDKVLDAVLYGTGGLTPQPPIEAQCQLANMVGCRLWYNIPTWATDNYITNALNTIFSNLTGIVELEYGNELWNFGFVGAHWCNQRSIVLGLALPGGSNLDYQALRIRQINGNLVPGSSYGAALNKINRLYPYQSGTGFGDTGITAFFNGNDLTNSTGQNAAYQAFVGGTGIDYSTSPNRPIDVCDSICYAPYWNGVGITGTSGPVVGQFANNTSNVAMLQSIINNTNSSNIAAANATIDNDIRQGTDSDQTFTTGGTTTFTTPSPHGFFNGDPIQFKVTGGTAWSGIDTTALYLVLSGGTGGTSTIFTCGKLTNDIVGPAVNAGTAGTGTTTVGSPHGDTVFYLSNHNFLKWEAVAASYDAGRPSGMAALGVQMYEGSGDLRTPNAAQCGAPTGGNLNLTSTGPSDPYTNAANVLAQAVINYKNDVSAKNTYIFYYDAFFGLKTGLSTLGAMAHSKGASHLVISGQIGAIGGEFSLCADLNPSNPLPYQWYYGVQAFNNGAR